MIRSEVIYPDRSKQVFKLRVKNDENQSDENDKNDKNNANSSKVRKFSQDVFLEKGIKSNQIVMKLGNRSKVLWASMVSMIFLWFLTIFLCKNLWKI